MKTYGSVKYKTARGDAIFRGLIKTDRRRRGHKNIFGISEFPPQESGCSVRTRDAQKRKQLNQQWLVWSLTESLVFRINLAENTFLLYDYFASESFHI